MVDLHRCVRSCDTVNDLSNIKHFSNTIKNLNLSVFNMIARTNESQTLIKHISYACKVSFMLENVIQIKSGIMENVDVGIKIGKNIICAINIIFGILIHVVVEMVNI